MKFYKNWTGIMVSLIMFLFLFSVTNFTTAQGSDEAFVVNTSELESQVIKTIEEGTSLTEALVWLEKEFDVNFFYKTEMAEEELFSNRYVLNSEKDLHSILNNLLPEFDLTYKVLTHRTLGIFKKGGEVPKPVTKMQVVSGQVTDASSGNSLPGVNVLVQGTSIGTSTDPQGNYSLEVPSLQDTLVFSFVGYQTKEVPINNRTTVDVELQVETVRGEEIVVSGYQSQDRTDVTGSISTVDADIALADKTVNNPIRSLQGQVAGLYVNTTGNPSGEDTEIRIRGASTLNDNSPLYVIDGVPTKKSAFNALNPNDIEDIQVLKDAPSSAIYGSRASNGVILITTKQSQENTFSVNYGSQVTFSRFLNRPEMTNPTERARAQFWANVYSGNSPDDIPVVDYNWERTGPGRFDYKINDVILPDMITPNIRANKEGTDWVGEITRTGILQQHDLSISTGGDRGGAVFSGRFYDNKYVYLHRNVSRYQVRVNSQYDVTEDGNVTIGENLSFATSSNRGFEDGLGDPLEGRALRPLLPVYGEEGDFTGPPTGNFRETENPVGELTINQDDLRQEMNLFGNVYANIDLRDNLSWNTNFGIDWAYNTARNIDRTYQWGALARDINSISNRDERDFNWTLNSTLNYQLDLENHSMTFLAGAEATQNSIEWNMSERQDFALQTLDYMVERSGRGAQIVDGFKEGFSLLSFFGKVDYAFDERYLASVTVRHDGSSKFAPGNRFGTFPSFSVGWRIDQESFMDDVDFISELKLRSGYGITGNQQIANDARHALYTVSYASPESNQPWVYDYGYGNAGTAYSYSGSDSGSLPSGFRKVQTANPEMQWEEAAEYNIGLDVSFNDDQIYSSVDYFNRSTSDILIQPEIIAAIGEGGDRFLNGATLEIQGVEFSTTYRDQFGDLNFRVSGNVGYFDDKITELPADIVDTYPGNSEKNILGRSPNAYFGYVADGLFDSQEEVEAHAEQPGKDIGRIRFKDLNNDGVINAQDQKFFGSSSANIEYGLNLRFNYQGFDLSMFWQGVALRDALESGRESLDFTSGGTGTNYSTRVLDAWKPDKKDTDIPALTLSDNNNEFRTSSFLLANGAYTKLRSLTLGHRFTGLGFAQNIRIYATGENLLTIKAPSFVGPDPERPSFNYPRPTKLNLGIDIQF